MTKVLMVLYENISNAEAALRELQRAGFPSENISLITKNTAAYEISTPEVTAAEGRDFGAVVGGLTGLVVGLGAIVIPGIGPIIAAGPLVALLGGTTGAVVGAGAGAITGGLSAALINLGAP